MSINLEDFSNFDYWLVGWLVIWLAGWRKINQITNNIPPTITRNTQFLHWTTIKFYQSCLLSVPFTKPDSTYTRFFTKNDGHLDVQYVMSKCRQLLQLKPPSLSVAIPRRLRPCLITFQQASRLLFTTFMCKIMSVNEPYNHSSVYPHKNTITQLTSQPDN